MSKEIRQMIDKVKSFNQFINESLNSDIKTFLTGKNFINSKSKNFFYHGTKIPPDKFILRDDYNGEDSKGWSGELPEGYLFLTTSLEEAKAYGQYIIPCELKRTDHITFTINADNPSQIFDRDYGIDLYMNDEHYGFWEKFEDSMKSVLIIKGTKRMTLITDISNVIPRTDLAIEFYNVGGKKINKKAMKAKLVRESLNEDDLSD
ncbi:hypothetical protein M0Q50_06700 [bacterium]|jgi:hypothetical protein|nr:hypothetical protein [bacterium]